MTTSFFHRILRLLALVVWGAGYALAQPAATDVEADTKIEPELLQTLQTQGSSALYVHFQQRADLSAVHAFSMDWAERGQYVQDTLEATAASSQAEARQLLDSVGLEYTPFLIGNLLYVERADLATVRALSRLPGVTGFTLPRTFYIDPPIIDKDADSQNLPQGSLAWGIADTKADLFWSTYGVEGEGIVVANIDTGVQWNHPALDQSFRCGTNPTDPKCWKDPSNVCGANGACDNNGHGTHTMGTMVGDNDASLTWQAGMAPDAKWIACKGCESNSCSDLALNSCADWILAPGGDTANRPHVVNNSWGGGGGDNWYLSKVEAWRAAGIFPAFSAGNKGPGCSTLGSPGDYQASFGSAAHDSGRAIASFSSRGPSAFGHDPYTKANLSAPGVSVCSALPGSTWSCGYSGTSMASPHSAGAVALLWSCNPDLVGQIDATFLALQDHADTPPAGSCGAPPDGEGNYTYGYGYLNVLAAGAGVCEAVPRGKLALNPTALSATLKQGRSLTLPLRLSNVGDLRLSFKITEHEVPTDVQLTEAAKTAIPAFTGQIPVSDVAVSAGPAPLDATDAALETVSTQAQPLGTLGGAPAFAINTWADDLVKIPDVDIPGTWSPIANKPDTAYYAGDFIGGDFSTLYVIDYTTNQLHALDTATGVTRDIGPATPRTGETWTGMSGGINGVMYASSTNISRSTLYRLNLATGAATEIGEITNAPAIIDIAVAPDASAIYGVDIWNDQLVRIDPATGAGAVVGSLGVNANYAQGMDFDDTAGILYWAAYESGTGGTMRVIDIQTGSSALVGAFPGGAEVDALGIATGGVSNVRWLDEKPKAGTLDPEAARNIQVTFDAGVPGIKPGTYQAKLGIQTDTPDGTLSVPVQMTVIDPRDLAVDFGGTGLWLYTLDDQAIGVQGAWDRIHQGNPSAVAGWSKGLAIDLDAQGLWGFDGKAWKRIDGRNPGAGGMAGWSKGLAVDFDAKGLWSFDGATWKKINAKDPGTGGMTGWSKGLAVHFDAQGLWSYDGQAWKKIDNRNPGTGGLAGWSKGLAVDFDAKGLWNYDGNNWKKIDNRNPGTGGLTGWSKGLAVDFDAAGLWSYNGNKWVRLTAWNPGRGGMSQWAGGLAVDFDARGLWNYDGQVWRRLYSGPDAEAVGTVTLP